MIFILRKRTIIAITAAILSLAVIGISLYEITNSPTSALPVSNKIIIVDAGHGGPDGGAVGADGTVEKNLNLKVALKLQKLLEKSGCTVFMTRADDRSLSTIEDEIKKMRKVADLSNRKKMVTDYEVEAFVSVHMNTFPDKQYKGSQVFYSASPAASKELADFIQEEIKQIDSENNRVSKDGTNGIFILHETPIPSVVVECGFLSNETDLQRLKTDEYQNKLASAIYNGILKFYSK